ncbi:hypothetical protein GWL_06160 [Herbaspirillum sp. GW103]|uniref:hypothetical protein n=1 Tax=Herbaspirillum sp. GW103 TaxID=1175306 RepID=UPI00025E2A7F|nr:hypothetical protein [Herbaspirillum sp. GW103]EIJ48582.1 hypothetical protein GWL_06160 [Herbaspirillum sp. GW103]
MNVIRKAKYDAMLARLRHPEKRTWIILNSVSIGETAATCAFADAFVKKHGYGITLVIRPEQKAIAEMFPGRFEQVIVATQAEQQEIQRFLPPEQFQLDIPFASYCDSLGDARTDNIYYLFKYPNRGGLSFTDCYRHLLMLPWDAKMQRPTIPLSWEHEAQAYASEVGIIPEESVILFPSTSSSHPQFPAFMWHTLIERLKVNGKKVFCNMKGGLIHPEKMPIDGTIPIEVPIHLAMSLARIAGRIITPPNGLHFLQMLGGQVGNITVVAPMNDVNADFVINQRHYANTFMFAEYTNPELLVDVPYAEFVLPYDASQEAKIKEIAVAVADYDLDHPAHFRRNGAGRPAFVEENRAWLAPLIDPIRRPNFQS